MNVTKRMRPRYRVESTKRVYGTKQKAYKVAAKRALASEFDHLGWYELEDNKASPALQAFREKWCEFNEFNAKWYPTQAYWERLHEIKRAMEEEDDGQLQELR